MIQLQKFRNQGLEFDETLDLEHLKEREPEIRAISPVRVKGKADIESKRVTFQLLIEGEMILPSSRTLEDVHFPIQIKSTEIFQYDATSEEDHDLNVHAIQGEMIDLQPIIEELILLEIPIQVYNEEDDISSAFPRSEGWQVVDESELNNEDKIDPRLAGLADLFKEKDSDG